MRQALVIVAMMTPKVATGARRPPRTMGPMERARSARTSRRAAKKTMKRMTALKAMRSSLPMLPQRSVLSASRHGLRLRWDKAPPTERQICSSLPPPNNYLHQVLARKQDLQPLLVQLSVLLDRSSRSVRVP